MSYTVDPTQASCRYFYCVQQRFLVVHTLCPTQASGLTKVFLLQVNCNAQDIQLRFYVINGVSNMSFICSVSNRFHAIIMLHSTTVSNRTHIVSSTGSRFHQSFMLHVNCNAEDIQQKVLCHTQCVQHRFEVSPRFSYTVSNTGFQSYAQQIQYRFNFITVQYSRKVIRTYVLHPKQFSRFTNVLMLHVNRNAQTIQQMFCHTQCVQDGFQIVGTVSPTTASCHHYTVFNNLFM